MNLNNNKGKGPHHNLISLCSVQTIQNHNVVNLHNTTIIFQHIIQYKQQQQ